MKSAIHVQKTRAGFSLVEVSIALGLLSFCMVALLGLLQFGVQQQRRSNDQMRGAQVLSAILDDFADFQRNPNKHDTPRGTTARFGLSVPNPGEGPREKILSVDEGLLRTSARDSSNAYVVYYRIEPPAAADGAYEPYKLRVCVAWPAAATFTFEGTNLRVSSAGGSEEVITEFNRG